LDILPDAFTDMSFWHFRTEGAFLISASRRNSVTEFISLYSEKGGKANIISCFGTDVDVYCDNQPVEYITDGDRIIIDTKQGEEYIICKKGVHPEVLSIQPVDPKPYELNYFGVKKVSRY
jgi:hypothetical protein